MTSRERVIRTLRFEHPDRLPRDVWIPPGGQRVLDEAGSPLFERYPTDFAYVRSPYRPSSRAKGDIFQAGEATDEWGVTFFNLQSGIHGEVKRPILPDIADWRRIKPPYETLPDHPAAAIDAVNRQCAASDRFMLAAACPRPWERYQFLRGSQDALMDMMELDGGAADLLRVIHEFYLRELDFWTQTDVDAVGFMDDWGSQRQLLINPALWREVFRPLYREYCDMAHSRGKFAFMHSDGHIAAIYPDLVEIGVDAMNSQLFCMDMAEIATVAKGKITFWGEIDRQHVMIAADPEVARQAVRQVARHFHDPAGGVICQFEFGPDSNPHVALAIFDEWDRVQQG